MEPTPSRLFDIPYVQQKNNPLTKLLNTKVDGIWQSESTDSFIEKFNQVSAGLIELGINKGDKIAIISHNNRSEWHIVDMAIQQVGAISVPVYPTITEEDYTYIFNHAEVKICFVSNQDLATKVSNIKNQVPTLLHIFTFEECKETNWKHVFELGNTTPHIEEIENRKNNIQPTDLVTIIYTSGTTGTPKGVMLSHNNILSNAIGCEDLMPTTIERVLSFLPICHIFERTAVYVYFLRSFEIYFAESIETIGDNAKEIKPHLMTVVPRLIEKVYDKIMLKATELKGIKRKLFKWAVQLGETFYLFEKESFWHALQLKIARKLIFSKWQEALGGELKVLICGSAKLDERLIRIFNAAQMPIIEGYGLTETSPVIAGAKLQPGKYLTGTCGKPLQNVEVKLAEDGEILVKGPNVMMGYYKNPELTKENFTEDGYFMTGDIGTITKDNLIKITDRKKEIFKTSGGKYITPQFIESKLKSSLFIEQAMVVGADEKMPCAFLQPDFEYIKAWIKEKNISIDLNDYHAITTHPEIINRIQDAVDEINKQFAQWEKIKKFTLVPDVWSTENGLITPTMKLKRKNIMKKYEVDYKVMYNKIN